MARHRFFKATTSMLGASALALACSGSASLGKDDPQAQGGSGNSGTQTGGAGAGTSTGGVSTGGVSTGGVSTGGVSAGTGGVSTGGVSAGTGGVSTGGVSTGGVSTGGASAGTGPTTGGVGTAGGAGASSGGAGGLGGSGGNVDVGQALTDPNTPGTAACSTQTLATFLATIRGAWPDLADITRLYAPNLVGDGNLIYAFRSANGFRVIFTRGSGDCPAGCIDHEYWYFESDNACKPTQVGHYARVFDSSANCYRMNGMALWGFPTTGASSSCPPVDLTVLNSSCVESKCPAGLTPDLFYGVAGTAGPQFCLCTIPCDQNPSVCPTGTTCTEISDGPGLVCYE